MKYTHNIDSLIKKNAPLEELFDLDDLLSAYRSQKKNLIDYFCKPNIIGQLLNFICVFKKDNEKYQYKYPYMISEILSEDIPQFRDLILRPEYLNRLLSVVERNQPIPSPHAHHICRVFHCFLTQNGKETLAAIEKKNMVSKIFNHLESFPFCEFLFDIIMAVEQQRDKAGVIEFFQKYDIIYSLLNSMQLTSSPLLNNYLVPPNAGQILTNIVRNFGPTHRSLLFTEIFREREIELLLNLSLSPNASLTNFTVGITLLIDIVWNTRYNPDDPMPYEEELPAEESLVAPPPPSFIQLNLLDRLERFVECLSYDWSSAAPDGNYAVSPARAVSPMPAITGTGTGTSTGGGGGSSGGTGGGGKNNNNNNGQPVSPRTSSSSSSSTNALAPGGGPTPELYVPCPTHLRKGRSVGNYRLKLIVLFSTLIRSGYSEDVDAAFIRSGAFPVFVNLFFQHPTNNIVHAELYTLFEQTMLFKSTKLKICLCVTSRLAYHLAHEMEAERGRAEERRKEVDRISDERKKKKHTPMLVSRSRVVPSSPLLSHVYHLARILQAHRDLIPELDTELLKYDQWQACYDLMVDPQMREQENGLMPLNADTDDVDSQYSERDAWNEEEDKE